MAHPVTSRHYVLTSFFNIYMSSSRKADVHTAKFFSYSSGDNESALKHKPTEFIRMTVLTGDGGASNQLSFYAAHSSPNRRTNRTPESPQNHIRSGCFSFYEATSIMANFLRCCRRDIKTAKKSRLFFQFLCCEYIIHPCWKFVKPFFLIVLIFLLLSSLSTVFDWFR